MNANLKRIIAALVLGSYGLAVAVSGAFHNHRGPVHEFCAPGNADRCHESSCSAHQDHDPAGHSGHDDDCDGEAADSRPLEINSHGDECAVCSFLAQKPVQETSPDEVACAYLGLDLARPKAVARVKEPFSAIWSRGPPSVA